MTKENVHLYLPFVQALAEGKDIEVLNPYTHEWEVTEDLLFSQLPETYRIKPEKKLVPFTWEDRELLRGKWVVDKYHNHEFMIYTINKEYACVFTYKDLFENFTFLDGSPCGKEVEE